MREYLGRSGNFVYFINLDTNECRVFNKFGKLEKSTSGLLGYAESKSFVAIDILSILGDPMVAMCEVYLAGYKCSVPLGYMEVLNRVSGRLPLFECAVYRIVHPEGVLQVLFPCKPGMLSGKTLEDLLGVPLVWTPLVRG